MRIKSYEISKPLKNDLALTNVNKLGKNFTSLLS